jgi:thiol-disulfide isomerase/thioredoxin
LGYYGYKWYASPIVNKKDYDDVANATRQNKDVLIYFLHVDWCPHCKTAHPQWDAFEKRYDGTSVNGYNIKCINVNCTDDKNEDVNKYIQQFDIQSYPTVKMIKDNSQIDYDAKITSDNLDQFLNATVNE